MQVIGTLFTTLIGGGGAAAAGGATAGGLSLMQAGGTMLGALATIGSGVAANEAGKAEQKQQQFEATNEYIRGKETSAALKRELARTVANQAVAFAAGGVDLGSVSVQQAKDSAVQDAETELGVASNEALSRSLQRQRAGRVARARGKAAMFSSFISAGQDIAKFGVNAAQRGT